MLQNFLIYLNYKLHCGSWSWKRWKRLFPIGNGSAANKIQGRCSNHH